MEKYLDMATKATQEALYWGFCTPVDLVVQASQWTHDKLVAWWNEK